MSPRTKCPPASNSKVPTPSLDGSHDSSQSSSQMSRSSVSGEEARRLNAAVKITLEEAGREGFKASLQKRKQIISRTYERMNIEPIVISDDENEGAEEKNEKERADLSGKKAELSKGGKLGGKSKAVKDVTVKLLPEKVGGKNGGGVNSEKQGSMGKLQESEDKDKSGKSSAVSKPKINDRHGNGDNSASEENGETEDEDEEEGEIEVNDELSDDSIIKDEMHEDVKNDKALRNKNRKLETDAQRRARRVQAIKQKRLDKKIRREKERKEKERMARLAKTGGRLGTTRPLRQPQPVPVPTRPRPLPQRLNTALNRKFSSGNVDGSEGDDEEEEDEGEDDVVVGNKKPEPTKKDVVINESSDHSSVESETSADEPLTRKRFSATTSSGKSKTTEDSESGESEGGGKSFTEKTNVTRGSSRLSKGGADDEGDDDNDEQEGDTGEDDEEKSDGEGDPSVSAESSTKRKGQELQEDQAKTAKKQKTTASSSSSKTTSKDNQAVTKTASPAASTSSRKASKPPKGSAEAKELRNVKDQVRRQEKKQSKLDLSGVTLADVQWAAEAILSLASICPFDAMAILRYIIMKLPPESQVQTPIAPETVPQGLDGLKRATSSWTRATQTQPTPLFCRAYYVVLEYRKLANKKKISTSPHDQTQVDAEAEAAKYLKMHNLRHVLELGIKVMTIVYAISPRNPFGLLLLAHMGFTVYNLQHLSKAKLIALVALLTPSQWHRDGKCSLQGGNVLSQLDSNLHHLVGFVTTRLIPGMECGLLSNLQILHDSSCIDFSNGKRLHPNLDQYISYNSVEDGRNNFRIIIEKATDTSAEETVIGMPLHLIHSRYRTVSEKVFNQGKRGIHYVSLCFDKVHIDWNLHNQLCNKDPITVDIIRGWFQYVDYWHMGSAMQSKAINTSCFYGKVKLRADILSECVQAVKKDNTEADEIMIKEKFEKGWDLLNPNVAFWGTFLNPSSKEEFEKKNLAVNFGLLTKEAVDRMLKDDDKSRSTYLKDRILQAVGDDEVDEDGENGEGGEDRDDEA